MKQKKMLNYKTKYSSVLNCKGNRFVRDGDHFAIFEIFALKYH